MPLDIFLVLKPCDLSPKSTGEKNRPPVRPQPNPLDSSAAYCAYGSIMAATISREQTGKGVFIDVAAMDAQVRVSTADISGVEINTNLLLQLASFSNAGVSWLWNKIEYTREGTGNAIAVPYAAVQTKDSMIMLGIGTNNQASPPLFSIADANVR